MRHRIQPQQIETFVILVTAKMSIYAGAHTSTRGTDVEGALTLFNRLPRFRFEDSSKILGDVGYPFLVVRRISWRRQLFD